MNDMAKNFDSSLQTMRSSKDKMETSCNSRKLSPNVLYIDDPVTFDDRCKSTRLDLKMAKVSKLSNKESDYSETNKIIPKCIDKINIKSLIKGVKVIKISPMKRTSIFLRSAKKNV